MSNSKKHKRVELTERRRVTVEVKVTVSERRNFGFFNAEPPAPTAKKPSEPTEHPPGSEGKIAVLAARYAAGEPLWHPQDRGHDEGDAGWSTLPSREIRKIGKILSRVSSVDARDHLGIGVAHQIGHLFGGEAGPDGIATVGVAEAVGRDAAPAPVIEAGTLGLPAKVVGEAVADPGPAIAVGEDVAASAGGSGKVGKELGDDGAERDYPGLPCLLAGLVFLQPDVRRIAKVNVAPHHLPQFAGPASRELQHEQGVFEWLGAFSKEGTVFLLGRWPAGLGVVVAQDARSAVRASVNVVLVFRPAESGQDRSDAPALGVGTLPSLVASQPFGQIVLSAIRDQLLPGKRDEVFERASKVLGVAVGQRTDKLALLAGLQVFPHKKFYGPGRIARLLGKESDCGDHERISSSANVASQY